MLLLLLACPPVRGVCPNHEVMMFQPQTVTPTYLGSVVNCYVATPFFLTLSTVICPPPDFPLGWWGVIAPAPVHSPVHSRHASTQDHFLTWVSPVAVPKYQYPSLPAPYSDSSVSLYPPPLLTILADFQRHNRVLFIYVSIFLFIYWFFILASSFFAFGFTSRVENLVSVVAREDIVAG